MCHRLCRGFSIIYKPVSLFQTCRYIHKTAHSYLGNSNSMSEESQADALSMSVSISESNMALTSDKLEEFNVVTEGKASILFPKSNEVFYNPVQEFNRDLSIAVIRSWSDILFEEREDKARQKALRQTKEIGIEASTDSIIQDSKIKPNSPKGYTILEALAATGLRSIRYAKELPNLEYVLANDLELEAVNSIKRNIKYNSLNDELVRTNQGDACDLLYQHRQPSDRFDVIDIDPYGTAAPFIDGSIQAVKDGGLLCITCTDAAVLTGANYPEKCYSNYGAMPVKGDFCHEMALRILLHALTLSASRYHRHIVPLVSLSIDFYIRVFVRIYTSPIEVKKAPCKTSHLYACVGCRTFRLQPIAKMTEKGSFTPMAGPPVNMSCDFCGNKFHIGGPIWAYPLHDKTFVQKLLQHIKASNTDDYKTHARMLGMLTVVSEEIDSPLYYSLSTLAGTIHCTNPPLKKFCSALLNQGYKVSTSHAAAGSLKTDAPPEIIWDIMKSWVKLNPVTWKNIKENSPAKKILSVEPSFEANFSFHKDAEAPSRKIKLTRYQMNPEKNWGPKARASNKKRKAIDDMMVNESHTKKAPNTADAYLT